MTGGRQVTPMKFHFSKQFMTGGVWQKLYLPLNSDVPYISRVPMAPFLFLDEVKGTGNRRKRAFRPKHFSSSGKKKPCISRDPRKPTFENLGNLFSNADISGPRSHFKPWLIKGTAERERERGGEREKERERKRERMREREKGTERDRQRERFGTCCTCHLL